MSSLLKHARLESGKTIEEAASCLKIKKQYLVALEEEKLELIPGEVYVKGYLKLYSNYLGVSLPHDEEDLHQMEEFPRKTILQHNHNQIIFKYRWKKHLVITSILVLITVFIIYTNSG